MSIAFYMVSLMTLIGLAVLGWLASPGEPEFDGERLFKMLLITLLRGEVEAEEGTVEEWERRVLAWVPYHPAGRFPEQKLSRPSIQSIPGPSLDGEQALIESLGALSSMEERMRRMYDEDAIGREARFLDPLELGPSYDPGNRIGPSLTWDAIAAWATGGEEVERWLCNDAALAWILVEGRPDGVATPRLMDCFAHQLGERCESVAWDHSDLESGVDSIASAASKMLTSPDRRLIFVGEEAGIQLILRALADSAPLRDRVLAVLSVGGILGGTEEDGVFGVDTVQDWMASWFQHKKLDTEIVRMTPYFSLQWMSRSARPPGVDGLELAASRFPEPFEDSTVPPAISPVDLGPLWVDDDLPKEQIVRALRALVASWLNPA